MTILPGLEVFWQAELDELLPPQSRGLYSFGASDTRGPCWSQHKDWLTQEEGQGQGPLPVLVNIPDHSQEACLPPGSTWNMLTNQSAWLTPLDISET